MTDCDGPLSYHSGDSLPAVEATVVLAGERPDYSTGWTFRVTLDSSAGEALAKTIGVFGQPDGGVLIAWDPADLMLPPGHYRLRLTGTHTTDGRRWTVTEQLLIT